MSARNVADRMALIPTLRPAAAKRRGRTLRQRGLSLLFALIALAIVSLAAVALVRSVDTGSLIVGNLGFKQDATVAAAQGAEAAITWLQNHAGSGLHDDVPASGYYASSRDALDVTGQASSSATRAVVDWDGNDCDSQGSFGTCVRPSDEISLNNGANRARYVITRLCASEGNPTALDCSVPTRSATSTGSNRGAQDYLHQKAALGVVNQQYYRIVVRALSGHGTVAFTETLVQF